MYLLQRIKFAWTQYRAFQASFAELNGYSDRELRDLGLTRADIVRTSYEEAEQRVEAFTPSRLTRSAALATAA
jgi:uncharacterized protein YjiS (DUF1127 family)